MAISILKIKGIGQASAATLAEFGFKTAEDVAVAKVEQLGMVPGFAVIRAKRTIADALSLLGDSAEASTKTDDSGQQGKQAKKKQKIGKNKKDKKGKKDSKHKKSKARNKDSKSKKPGAKEKGGKKRKKEKGKGKGKK